LLAHFDVASGDWEIVPGRYTVGAGPNAGELPLTTEVTLAASRFTQGPRRFR